MTTPTMMIPLRHIQKFVQRIWGNWNIYAIVVASLGFQCVLEFLGPLRKRRKRGSTHIKIWCAYLLADYFATFGIALINSNSDDQSSLLEAFWAPFLLLHLGGPHAITSFDIEDNNLWHRQLLTLIVQSFSVLLVFYRYKIYNHRCLAISAWIVFSAGIVKYTERIHSLYLASVYHMRRSMLENNPSSSSLSKETEEALVANNPDKMEIIHSGYIYYKLFKGFILDHAFIHIEDKLVAVKEVFWKLDHKTAYAILEVELNFMYESMFTKMAAVQWINSIGYAYRFVVHVLLVAVIITFYFCDKSEVGATPLYLCITYLLLGGAVVLDFVANVKLVFSEWTVALMKEEKKKRYYCDQMRSWISGIIMKLIHKIHTWVWSKKRWSKRIRQYSLINHSSKQRWKPLDTIINRLSLIRDRLDAWQYTKIEKVDCHLLERLFRAIKNKAKLPEEEGQGGGEQQLMSCSAPQEDYHHYNNCVLIWHVATEICYFTTGKPAKEKKEPNYKEICRNISEYLVYFLAMEGKLTSTVPGNIGLRFKDICREEVDHTIKKIKDELPKTRCPGHHLLGHISAIISAKLSDFKDAAIITLANRNRNNNAAAADTCHTERTRSEKLRMKWEDKKRGEVCKQLLELKLKDDSENPSEDGTTAKTNDNKSILSEAIKLAKHLKSCCRPNPADNNNPHQNEQDVENGQGNDEDRCSEEELWEVVSHVWIGMLLYGASHCRDDVQYLNKGGELLTFVRLLMVHFGLRDAFKDEGATAGGFKLAAELHKEITDEKLKKIINPNFLP
ncbi:uncharacterized protein LOC116025045 [Ipomoea triloba]|uniref:uncharacterized protein LOC116025045 n=1 Tax=Ipomoea triloba TaxID=35885 RepID=UPI00125D253C|nr:uncharacterized protein LOC116025045 [Ipomoea triloba]